MTQMAYDLKEYEALFELIVSLSKKRG